MNQESNKVSRAIKTMYTKSRTGKSLKQFARSLSVDNTNPDSSLATQWFKNKKPQPKAVKIKIKKSKSKE